MSDPVDLAGRVCIVTGGGNGLGAVVAHELADHGATVVVNDLGTDVDGEGESPEPAEAVAAEIRDAGGDATAHFGDVADLDYAERLVEETVKAHGRLDAVCNFAGFLRDGFATNLSEEDWDAVIRVHLKGHFGLFRAAARHWREVADGGALSPQRTFLAVSSLGSKGNVGQLNYSTAKAGVLGFTRSASSESFASGIRVNALIPSGFTRMTASVAEEYRPYTREEMPPERVGPAVAFLVSDAAEDVTGVTLFAGGDELAIFSDPEAVRTGVRPGGWSAAEIAEHFEAIAGDVDLTRTERYV